MVLATGTEAVVIDTALSIFTTRRLTTLKDKYLFSEHPSVRHYDWRLAAVTSLSEQWRSPSGHIFQPGTPVVAVCPVQYDAKSVIQFNMPSVCALLVDYAHRLWQESRELMTLFTAGDGTATNPRIAAADGILMENLERRMAAVVFSYTALEAFANEVIEEAYTKKSFVYSRPSPKTGNAYSLEEIERYASLDDKLCSILPEISGVKSPKKTPLWPRYGRLKKVRHFIVHPKLPDKVQKSPEAEVLWKLLTDAAFRDFASDALEIMMHFAQNGSHPARWLHTCPIIISRSTA